MSGTDGASGYGLSAVHAAGAMAAPALDYRPRWPARTAGRIGLIGCGGIAEYHLRAYRAMGLEVIAMCDRDRAKAERRRDEFFPGAAVAADWREVVRRDDIAVVDAALHPEPRVEVVAAALRAGKHVLSQKPFVVDLDEGERLAALARENGVRLAVNQNGRWAPHFAWMAAAVRAGLIGDVASVDCTLHWDHTWTAGTPFEEIRHLVLFDFGIHWFDIATQFMGGRRAERVTATTARAAGQTLKAPLLAQAALDFKGAQARLAFNGHVRHGQRDTTVICGSAGTLRSEGPSLSEQRVWLETAAGRTEVPLEGTWFTSGFQGAMGELLAAIAEDRPPSHDATSALPGLAACFAATASADAGGVPTEPGTVRRAPR